MHSLGVLHLDLKLDNILLMSSEYDNAKSSKLVLVDFNASQMFRDSDGNHITDENIRRFYGNISFSSPHQMNFRSNFICLILRRFFP